MKKISLTIIILLSLISSVHSQDISIRKKAYLKVTFGRGFNFDTVSLSINGYLIINKNVVKSSLSDGLTDLHLNFLWENGSVKVYDLDGNIYKVPKIESIFNLNVCVNHLMKNSTINLEDGKFIIINYKENKIHCNQHLKRPRFF